MVYNISSSWLARTLVERGSGFGDPIVVHKSVARKVTAVGPSAVLALGG